MNISLVGKDCVGCENCSNVCPEKVIKMQSDIEGFIYPVIYEGCIDCGKCLESCPQSMSHYENTLNQKAYMAISEDRILYQNGASAGIFGTMADQFFKVFDNAYVCGAAYYNGEVRHVIISSSGNISSLQNSKYVQSRLYDLFGEIKKKIVKGANVLFSGTPCQVTALFKYLGRKPNNLYTVDLICHGVPNQKFLLQNTKHYEKVDKITNIGFRWKVGGTQSGFFF